MLRRRGKDAVEIFQRARAVFLLKTVKISVVATIALVVGWWLRIPHRMWPAHPMLADLLMGIVLCVLLQVLWVEPRPAEKK